MTKPKHLPECFNGRQRSGGLPCICDRLRACEERVNSSNLTLWNRTKEEARHMIDAGLGIAWKDGFKEGLDAAREALAAIQGDNSGLLPRWVKRDALAAIDALKGEHA